MIVMFFTATWCGPCKMYKKELAKPEVQAALKKFPVSYIDVDTDKVVANHYNVSSMPTTVLVDDDGKEIARKVGIIKSGELIQWLEKY